MASSLVVKQSSPQTPSSTVYAAPQQVQYLYLEAELDVLLRQLQTTEPNQN